MKRWIDTAVIALTLAATSFGQRPAPEEQGLLYGSHVVIPQTGGFALERGRSPIRIEEIRAHAEIVGQAATTTLEVTVGNPASGMAEAFLLLPVPEGVAVTGFDFEGSGSEPSATLLPKEEARATYQSIVDRVRDPALLEFVGHRLIRSRVFPVPPRGTQRVRLVYSHVLPADGDRVDYELVRSESLAYHVKWTITAEIRSAAPISTVYSSSHPLAFEHRSPNRVRVRTESVGAAPSGTYRLSYLLEGNDVSASVLACPDAEAGGGHFLLLAGLPASIDDWSRAVKREVVLVLDRSGSMGGEKIEQAKRAASQVLEGLAFGEAFNIVDYSGDVSLFSAQPVVKTGESIREARDYLATLTSAGGTNLHEALRVALAQPRAAGDGRRLPLVLFLTDGLPTQGITSEVTIRDLAVQANPYERRVYTFGVGADVNVPLLDRVADESRGTSTYVLPGEDVEVKVGNVFDDLYGPVLADVELEVVDENGAVDTRAVRDLMPRRIPDLFEGDQLVLLGRYLKEGLLRFRLHGDFFGERRTFAFECDMARANPRNTFVPRLWASRRLGFLVDELRQDGAESTAVAARANGGMPADPRQAELVNEILRLSTEYGVLTEYTAFLATEGTDLSDWDGNGATTAGNVGAWAMNTRSGVHGLSQDANIRFLQNQNFPNNPNVNFTGNLTPALAPGEVTFEEVSYATVQQMGDRALFRRGNRWIDARLVEEGASFEPDEVIDFGSEAHAALLRRFAGEGLQGVLSLHGEVLVDVDGRAVLVRNATRSQEGR